MQHHKRQITVLLTAGHAATTALATIEELNADPDISWNVSWIGPAKSLEGTKLKPFELDLFPKLGVDVYSITAGKLQSKFTRHTIPALLKIPIGFVSSIKLIRRIKPDVVLSFGGFAAVPVVVAATVLHIPVVLHEQTVAAGLANRISGFFATKIALARAESKSYFPKAKCEVTGNPLTQEVLKVKPLSALPKVPTIYVTGGSRGAQRVNNPVFATLPKLLVDYKIIHQTGILDFEKATELKKGLPRALQSRYEVYSFINPLHISEMYEQTSLLIGRAGANTVSEAMALGIPSIFIPIPWTRSNEQTKNALHAESAGIGVVLLESKLSAETLIDTIHTVMSKWADMSKVGKQLQVENLDRVAAHALVSLLLTVLS